MLTTSIHDFHHTIEDLGSSLRITIRTPKPWIRIGITSVLLAAWGIFEILVGIPFLVSWFSSLPSSITPFNIFFLLPFICVFTFAGIRIGYQFIFILLGKEIIEIDNNFIIRRNQFLFLTRSIKYPANEVSNIRVSPIVYSQEYRTWPRADIWWDNGEGPITFDFEYKTIRLGSYIDEPEANAIVAKIEKAYPQYVESA